MICILYLLRYSLFVCYIIFLFKKKSPISGSTPTCSPLRPETSTILWAIQLSKVEKWPCIVIEGNAKNCFDPLSFLLTIPGLGEIVIQQLTLLQSSPFHLLSHFLLITSSLSNVLRTICEVDRVTCIRLIYIYIYIYIYI